MKLNDFFYICSSHMWIFFLFLKHIKEKILKHFISTKVQPTKCVCCIVKCDFFCTSPYCAMWLYKFMSHLYLKTPKICQLSEPFSYYFCNRLFGLFHKPFCYLKQIDIHIRRRKGRKKSVGLYQHQTYLILNTLPEKLFLLCF